MILFKSLWLSSEDNGSRTKESMLSCATPYHCASDNDEEKCGSYDQLQHSMAVTGPKICTVDDSHFIIQEYNKTSKLQACLLAFQQKFYSLLLLAPWLYIWVAITLTTLIMLGTPEKQCNITVNIYGMRTSAIE